MHAVSTAFYTLSLHDALPIYCEFGFVVQALDNPAGEQLLSAEIVEDQFAMLNYFRAQKLLSSGVVDRKSTRLNSSHRCISYAVFCLKKKKNMEFILQVRLCVY